VEGTGGASKQELVDRIHELIGLEAEPLGPGSKERKATFVALARWLGLGDHDDDRKPEIARAIATHLDIPWVDTFTSSGDSITTKAIEAITVAAESLSTATSVRTDERHAPMNPDHSEAGSDEGEDGRADLQVAIAELVVALAAVEVPAPGTATVAPDLDVSEVDFTTGSWLVALASVQGWMRLEEEIDLSSPRHGAISVCRGLGISPEIGVEQDTRLSLTALDQLRRRLERSEAHQQRLLEDLDADGATLSAATERWSDAWEEDDAGADESSTGPVSAKAQTWNIVEFRDMAAEGELNLSPSYQRGDVWPTGDAQLLMESILRGIPLPSVIILKPEDQVRDQWEVVDGKQRLTAILRFIGHHPLATRLVERVEADHGATGLLEDLRDDYPRFRRRWKHLTGEALTASLESRYYFPFKLRAESDGLSGQLAPLKGKYYSQIRTESVRIADDEVQVRSIFEKSREYKIPVIEYSRASRRQIHEVFNLYNKQGKHLNAEEIRNALYHQLDLMRGLIVASGDNRAQSEVAPFFEGSWDLIGTISVALDDYAFGDKRYRRTKLLSWLASIVFQDMTQHGAVSLQSTARHIDQLLRRVEEDPGDPLAKKTTLREAFMLLAQAIEAHSGAPHVWAPSFRHNRAAARWQELQLVASLTGVTLASAVLGEQTATVLDERAAELRELSATEGWQRPGKTQTKEQWEYVGRVSTGIIEVLGVDLDEIDDVMTSRFTYSPVGTLLAARDIKAP
jgi:hypothetical protein